MLLLSKPLVKLLMLIASMSDKTYKGSWKALYRGKWHKVLDVKPPKAGEIKNDYLLDGVKEPIPQDQLQRLELAASTSFLDRVEAMVVPVNFGGKPVVKPQRPEPKTPAERIARKHADRAEKHGIPMHKLLDRLESTKRMNHEGFNSVMEKEHDEPYHGDDVLTQYRKNKPAFSGDPSVTPFPLPVVVKDLKGILGKGVPQGTGADPFMWLDAKYGATKAALKAHHDKPLEIHTRSDLICHDDYLALLNPNKHKVFIHLFTEDPATSNAIESGCPSPKRRLLAADKLKNANINVTIVLDAVDISPFLRKVFKNNLSNDVKSHFKTIENKLHLSEAEKKRLTILMADNDPKPDKPERKPAEVVPLRRTS